MCYNCKIRSLRWLLINIRTSILIEREMQFFIWNLNIKLTCSKYYSVFAGVIECVCTTADCQLEHRTMCEANHMCYVQYMSPSDHPGPVHVVRGCIDERTPLLCENRRPQAYTGSWPVLHCCRDSYCNKDVLPTDPTWLSASNGTYFLCTSTRHLSVSDNFHRKYLGLAAKKIWKVEIMHSLCMHRLQS